MPTQISQTNLPSTPTLPSSSSSSSSTSTSTSSFSMENSRRQSSSSLLDFQETSAAMRGLLSALLRRNDPTTPRHAMQRLHQLLQMEEQFLHPTNPHEFDATTSPIFFTDDSSNSAFLAPPSTGCSQVDLTAYSSTSPNQDTWRKRYFSNHGISMEVTRSFTEHGCQCMEGGMR
ncbi:hypothetical protein HMI56_003365 [Coelomomyces lativittatus]|nr:hypothetical protein HMI56_003365 [Coelomomyces lativittatus]